MVIREQLELLESERLSPYAALSSKTRGRDRQEEPCQTRGEFARDADRITHSKSFRRLMHKTQVFLMPEGDHYRTRMTHAMEVSRIARAMARALRLNEDLTEAISLGHDLGHAPFGHAGERALNDIVPGGFSHNEQSKRLVEVLEKDGRGLNLTYEVREGMLSHSGDVLSETLEGRLVYMADRVAYLSHDLDDAVRGGILRLEDVPFKNELGSTPRERINTLVTDIIAQSAGKPEIKLSLDKAGAMAGLREFMFERVYLNPAAKAEEMKVNDFIGRLYEHYIANYHLLPIWLQAVGERDGRERAVCDYLSGMTDRYIERVAVDTFIPRGWNG